jgi:Tfp pilus assembly protein PilE
MEEQADAEHVAQAAESYFSDNGTYSGMTISTLKANYDQAINLSTYKLGGTLSDTHYCIQATSPNQTAAKDGPSNPIVSGGTCP